MAELPRDVYSKPTWFEETVGRLAPPLPIHRVNNADLKTMADRGYGVVGVLLEPGYDPLDMTYIELSYVLSGALMMREALAELMNNANLTPLARELIHRCLRQTKYIPRAGQLVPDWIKTT